MNEPQIEQALGLVRGRLVEWIAEDRWCEHRWSELADTVREFLRRRGAARAPASRRIEPRLTRDELRRVTAYVRAHLDSKLTWQQIAAGARMAPLNLAMRFKRTTGITLHQYVIRCRIRKAKRLLADNRSSLADIALDVGCSCQSHFTTLFRRSVGLTPGEFRRRGAPRPHAPSAAAAQRFVYRPGSDA